jgi:hypothetical protein
MTIAAQPITVSREEALDLWRAYQRHRHYSKPIDFEVQRAYKAIAQGKMVIQALAALSAAGLGANRLPRLAICRADARACHLRMFRDGAARFGMRSYHRPNEMRQFIDFASGSFPGGVPGDHRAVMPLIPVHLRPRRGIENYHVLWEAVWEPIPPVDPLLLRRIGRGDLWTVVAQWELTAVEQAVLASRIPVR